ncbi:MAG: phage terminase large subunit [Hyphomicrobiaceae bacterium]
MTTATRPHSPSPNSSVSPQQAAQELLRRRTARKSLLAFTEYTYPQYVAAAHHKLIADHLEAVVRGDIDRLMINMPPRHGKSELASRRLPAWFLGLNPRLNVIGASYNIDLARDFGRDVRNIVRTPEFHNVFPDVALAEDSKAQERWNTNHGGAYVAAGVGTAVTGRGADIFLIDDPLKDRADADSEVRRQTVWEWYTSTAYTRLAPGGRIIVIQTRWHEDDLSGRLIDEEKRGGDQWVKLELPAIDEHGQALWPEFYPIEALERIRGVLPSREWTALYQQRPTPDDGDFFQRDWFKFYDRLPAGLRFYGASDYAVKDGGGDYTVHIVVGVDLQGNIYVVDMWRGQKQTDVWVEQFLNLIEIHKPLNWAEEKGQILNSLDPFIVKRMRERRVFCRREQFASVADKPTRARAFQGRAAMGMVYLPHGAPWVEDLLAELLVFPAGKHDDMVDALGLIGRLLDTMTGATIKRQQDTPADRWRRAYAREREAAHSWKTA